MGNTNLDKKIKTLKEYIVRMLDKCKKSVDLSIKSMETKDIELAQKIIDDDDDIDILREYIRDRSIELMALKQPMARDLRYVYALLDISSELERIGDCSVNIAKEIIEIGSDDYIKELVHIPEALKCCQKMFEGLREAFINQDEDLAYKIVFIDNEIDLLYYKIRQDCQKLMQEDAKNVNQGLRLVFIGRNLERVGDHITNICEKVIYAKNGRMIEIG